MKKTELFFITGMLRTGTTLLDKLLHNHPEARSLSQPAQPLFLYCKKRFLEQAGLPVNYLILSHYFAEKNYQPETFKAFLNEFQLNDEQLSYVNAEIEKLRQKNTFFTKAAALQREPHSSFLGLYKQLVEDENDPALAAGLKESLSEEYMPYLLEHGVKCIVVFRDPRDTMASSYFGSGKKYTGPAKPLLLMLRNWRKSLAFALELAKDKNFLSVRYEDLVADTNGSMERITSFLGLSSVDFTQMELKNQDGQAWSGNSSFESISGVSGQSVGTFRKQMPCEMQHFIESVCFPEMRYLKYETDITTPDLKLISEYSDPFEEGEGPAADAYRAESAAGRVNEIERLQLLNKSNVAESVLRQYFVYPAAYAGLRASLSAALKS